MYEVVIRVRGPAGYDLSFVECYLSSCVNDMPDAEQDIHDGVLSKQTNRQRFRRIKMFAHKVKNYPWATIFLLATLTILMIALSGAASAQDTVNSNNSGSAEQEIEANCALLDDPQARGLMGGMLETKLLLACDRADELGQVESPQAAVIPELVGADVLVNNPAGDAGGSSHTQSETSMALNEDTGTLCSGYNDSYHAAAQGTGYTGFSRSTNGGASWVDGGALSSSSFGDPSLVWRRADGYFYFAALHSNGLGIWRSTNDCQTFVFHGMIHTGDGDD
jgi:hypothetical protein